MPRNPKPAKKRNKPQPDDVVKKAVAVVMCKEASVRLAADAYDIPKSALHRYVQLARTKGLDNVNTFQPNYNNQKVFTNDQEKMLCEYFLTTAKLQHGFTTIMARQFAFENAVKVNAKFPESWRKNKQAGIDWLQGFRARFQSIAVRMPEATSLGRLTSFNKTNVSEFFDNLEKVLLDNNLEPRSIYTVNETELTTVHKPPRVLAAKNSKQVGQVTSGERGVLGTVAGCVSVIGNAVPPFAVFPQVNFKPSMLNGPPAGSAGAAQPTG